jgi:hypothetical protein
VIQLTWSAQKQQGRLLKKAKNEIEKKWTKLKKE